MRSYAGPQDWDRSLNYFASASCDLFCFVVFASLWTDTIAAVYCANATCFASSSLRRFALIRSLLYIVLMRCDGVLVPGLRMIW